LTGKCFASKQGNNNATPDVDSDKQKGKRVTTNRQLLFLKLSFAIGTIADFVVGVNWLLISLGYNIPNLISSFEGSGTDYRFAMYIGTIFMFSWTVLLAWGYLKPLERRDLLAMAAVLLSISIAVELLFYRNLLDGTGFLAGIILRLLLIGKFTFSYVYSGNRGRTADR
jgi:hypothetical protein